MIYTVTLNPSLDYMIRTDRLKKAAVNRVDQIALVPGGKGINVSLMLCNLGMLSAAFGFIAGVSGQTIAKELGRKKIRTDFVIAQNGNSRINVKLQDADGETEMNAGGPIVMQEELHAFFQKLDILAEGDWLVLAGSIPESLPSTIYCEIMERLEGRGVKIVVDTAGEQLLHVLPQRPFLVKPNHHELGALFDAAVTDKKTAAEYAGKLRDAGAQNVLVSMAKEGSVLLTEKGEVFEQPAPGGQTVNSIGAGDSMVAGFVYGYETSREIKTAFRWAAAAGSASACLQGMAERKDVEKLLADLL